MDAKSEYVDLQVSHELHVLFAMQDRINKFLWTSEAAYSYVLAKLDGLDADQDAEVALGVQSNAWEKAASGRRHFEGSLGVFRNALKENSQQLYGTVFVQYYAAFERYVLQRSGAHRRRPSEQLTWSPLIGGVRHLGDDRAYPVPLERLLRADISRFVRNLIAHGDDVPSYADDLRIDRWKRRTGIVLKGTAWPGEHEASIQEAAGQVFGTATRMAARFKLPAIYFYMLYSFTNLSALALAIEEALFDPAAEEGYTVRRQAKYVRRTNLIIPPSQLGSEQKKAP